MRSTLFVVALLVLSSSALADYRVSSASRGPRDPAPVIIRADRAERQRPYALTGEVRRERGEGRTILVHQGGSRFSYVYARD
jgi:hypothetical protein